MISTVPRSPVWLLKIAIGVSVSVRVSKHRSPKFARLRTSPVVAEWFSFDGDAICFVFRI